MELSDSLLIAGVRRGNDDAFDALYRRYYRQVHAALMRLVGEEDAAQDLAQETFLRLHRRPPGDSREPNVGAWLYRVALNLGYNALREARRRQARQEHAARVAIGGDVADPALATERNEEREQVRLALTKLPANYQAALVLRYQGLAYAEIGRVLGISANAVGTVLVRAEKQFKARYLEHGAAPGGHNALP